MLGFVRRILSHISASSSRSDQESVYMSMVSIRSHANAYEEETGSNQKRQIAKGIMFALREQPPPYRFVLETIVALVHYNDVRDVAQLVEQAPRHYVKTHSLSDILAAYPDAEPGIVVKCFDMLCDAGLMTREQSERGATNGKIGATAIGSHVFDCFMNF